MNRWSKPTKFLNTLILNMLLISLEVFQEAENFFKNPGDKLKWKDHVLKFMEYRKWSFKKKISLNELQILFICLYKSIKCTNTHI